MWTPEKAAKYQRIYHKKNKTKLDSYAKEWNKTTGYGKKRYQADKENMKAKAREYNFRTRAAIFELLGKVCGRCGFEDMRALQIDHVNGGGSKENKSLIGVTKYTYILKKVADGSTDYQILCANCNWIKRCENGEVRKSNK